MSNTTLIPLEKFSVARFRSTIIMVVNPNKPTTSHVSMTAGEARAIAAALLSAAKAVELRDRL